MELEMDETFFKQLANLNGRLFSAGLLSAKEE